MTHYNSCSQSDFTTAAAVALKTTFLWCEVGTQEDSIEIGKTEQILILHRRVRSRIRCIFQRELDVEKFMAQHNLAAAAAGTLLYLEP